MVAGSWKETGFSGGGVVRISDLAAYGGGKDQGDSGGKKSADWKLAIAAELKRRSTVTNRWLAGTMQMGNFHEVSRKVTAWQRKLDKRLPSLLVKTPNLKA